MKLRALHLERLLSYCIQCDAPATCISSAPHSLVVYNTKEPQTAYLYDTDRAALKHDKSEHM